MRAPTAPDCHARSSCGRSRARRTGWGLALAGLLAVSACGTDGAPAPNDDLPAGGGTTGGPAPQFGVPLGADALVPRSPVRLAHTASGWLLVTDAAREVVYRVDPQTLRADQALAIDGKPLAVGMSGDRIFIGNATRHTVEVFNHLGQRVGSLGAAGSIGYPSDLAVDPGAGLVFVLDGLDRTVKVFETGGTLRRVIGTGATFETPIGVAVNPAQREVLVSDYGNPGASLPAAVKIFTYGGDFVGAIAGGGTCSAGTCRGAFSRPQGLATDDSGHVYLTDALQSSVLVFDRSTRALAATIDGTGRLRLPSDVALGADGTVFVTSNLGAEVVRFSGMGVTR